MAEEATKAGGSHRGGPMRGLLSVVEELEVGGAAGPARVLFDLGERLIILLIVIALALLVSRSLNYFLSYLAPKEEITGG